MCLHARPQAHLHVKLLRIRGQRHMAQGCPSALARQLPGHQVAVVLRHRHYHLTTPAHAPQVRVIEVVDTVSDSR